MTASFYSTSTEVGRTVSKVSARDTLTPADQADLKAVLLFVTIGLLLTAAFSILGFGAEIGRIMVAPG
jgi:hypothetical protein